MALSYPKHADTFTRTHTHRRKYNTQRHTRTHTRTHCLLLSLRHTQAMGKLLAANKNRTAARKELDAAEKKRTAAKKELDAAKKELDADPKCKVREKIFTFAMEFYTEAHRDVLLYSQMRRRILQNQAPLTGAQTNFNANIKYRAHKTDADNLHQTEIQDIPKIPINTGQAAIPVDAPLQLPVGSDLFHKIIEISEKSCQISLNVVNFLVTRRVSYSEAGTHPLVDIFKTLIVDTCAHDLQQARDTNDASSSHSPASRDSGKSKNFRADAIISYKGQTLVRIEEKSSTTSLKIAQNELVCKISKAWWVLNCNVPFVIGIAVAGEIWTFHRITFEHVRSHQKLDNWAEVDMRSTTDRLTAIQLAVNIASLLNYFATRVHPRTVKVNETVSRSTCSIKITESAVEKWYVSY